MTDYPMRGRCRREASVCESRCPDCGGWLDFGLECEDCGYDAAVELQDWDEQDYWDSEEA